MKKILINDTILVQLKYCLNTFPITINNTSKYCKRADIESAIFIMFLF